MSQEDKFVYILGDGGHDYSDAERFGDLRIIDIPPSIKWDTAKVYDLLKEELHAAHAEDYLVISHLTSVCCIATALMIEWFGKVNFLIYHHGVYEHKTIDPSNLRGPVD